MNTSALLSTYPWCTLHVHLHYHETWAYVVNHSSTRTCTYKASHADELQAHA